MKIYTIGFTKKSAESFFSILQEHKISQVIDIRLNNFSQLAGFSKGKDLRFFLKTILNIEYEHMTNLAPSKEILDSYKKKLISWKQYEVEFVELLMGRDPKILTSVDALDGVCFLCSEDKPDQCHRRLVVELIKNSNPDIEIEIVHL